MPNIPNVAQFKTRKRVASRNDFFCKANKKPIGTYATNEVNRIAAPIPPKKKARAERHPGLEMSEDPPISSWNQI